MNIHWAAPAYAWIALLVVPAALLLGRATVLRRRALGRLTGDDAAAPAGSAGLRARAAHVMLAISLLLILAALCRPQWGEVALQEQTQGVDIVIALDVSRSMLADDLVPTRLAAAKEAVGALLPKLKGDRVGLVAFSGSAFVVCPLTTDYGLFGALLADVGPDTLPQGGTALAGALVEGLRAFDQTTAHGRVLVVISDGEDHGADLAAAVAALRGAGVTVHAVAAGTTDGALIPLAGGGFLKDRQGAVVKSRLQPDTLAAIVATTGGRVRDLASDRETLARLQTTGLFSGQRGQFAVARQQRVERFQIPLALALLLLLVEPFVRFRDGP